MVIVLSKKQQAITGSSLVCNINWVYLYQNFLQQCTFRKTKKMGSVNYAESGVRSAENEECGK